MCNYFNKCEDGKCRLAVAVEDNFAPCTLRKKQFDIEIRSKDGCFETFGKVYAGGSQVFSLPCNDDVEEYSVTVIGDMNSSPRAQTRRICCRCGCSSGITFVFMVYETDCNDKPYPTHPPKPYPPHPHPPNPCPPHPHPPNPCPSYPPYSAPSCQEPHPAPCSQMPLFEMPPMQPDCPCEDVYI